MNNGYLKLYRSMLDWEWYQDSNTCRLWIHILLKANWKKGRFMGTEVPEGSFITSSSQLSEETGLSRQQVRTSLNHLKSTNEITIKSTNKWMHIFVEKWTSFQVEEDPLNQQINQQTNQQLTNSQPATNQQLTTIEERKKEKKKKGENYYSIYSSSKDEEEPSKIRLKFLKDHQNEVWMNEKQQTEKIQNQIPF